MLGLALAAPPTLVDRVVADVDGQLILLSEVAQEAILTEVDVDGTPFWDPNWLVPEQRLVSAAIVRNIAADVRLYEPSRQDVERRLEAIRGRFPRRRAWQAFLDRLSVDEARLAVLLRRRMVVDRYLRRNLLADPADPVAFQAVAAAHLEELYEVSRVRWIPVLGEAAP